MWNLPEPGDIVWGNFPEDSREDPGPKPRPCLVISVSKTGNDYQITVASGTSKKLDKLYTGDVSITERLNKEAYQYAGLKLDTKFQLSVMKKLPWNDHFFGVRADKRFGDSPKIGKLHESMMRAFAAAYNAVKNSRV